MTNTYEFAKRELDLLLEFASPDDRPIVEPFIPEILALCEKYGQSGQSGGSEAFTSSVLTATIMDLLRQRPLQPLTGAASEWMNVSDMDDKQEVEIYQNVRHPAVFKEGKDGIPYFLDAIIWRYENGETKHGAAYGLDGQLYHSRQSFVMPFSPITFYVDVANMENMEHPCMTRYPQQLEDVYRYYLKPGD